MVDFGQTYYGPMDQGYHTGNTNADKRTDPIEEPIFPIHSIGKTIAWERKGGNIIQEVEAAFKMGAGNIQLALENPGQYSAMGGGAKMYGSEVREAIREIQKASGAKITGVELPTSINNLSGYDAQHGVFSEEQRRTTLDEVRDNIKFIGDIAGGGTVDVVSFEFDRNLSDANWYKKDEASQKSFKQRGDEYAKLVDTESGKVIPIKKNDEFFLYYDPETLKETKGTANAFTWQQMEKLAKEKGKTPEMFYIEQNFQNQIKSINGNKAHYNHLLMGINKELNAFENLKKENPNEFAKHKSEYDVLSGTAEGYAESINSMNIQEKQLQKQITNIKPIAEYALGQSTKSYAEAGIWAMQESQKNEFVQKGKGSVSVGPEIGWPQYYGSHPKEWVELIKKSREEMINLLTEKRIDGNDNPYYQGVSKKEAEQYAKQHIKGELDTSHLGMWFQNFKTDRPYDERLRDFKKWYRDQMDYIAEENKKNDIIGGIQVVDSASGAHGHLPPGQGILGKEIYDYMKILKEKGGYKGELTSEGHEDYMLGPERILTKAWETFGSPISMGYAGGYSGGRAGPQFRDIRNSQAQIAYGTTGIFSSYVPSNDFTLWSNVPFE